MLAELDVKRKAQNELINTLAADKWRNRNYELNLYGRGKDQAYLEKIIKEKNLSSRVYLKGFTRDVRDVLTNSHVVLQLTRFDAMPIAITEALSLARPVVVSDVGDMPRWVKGGVNGWVAGKLSTDEIDTVLENVWQNRNKLEKMGCESYRIFKEKYPLDPIKCFLEQAGILSNEQDRTT
jgi:glycosyltransferase involved in cell wall biosynthesis